MQTGFREFAPHDALRPWVDRFWARSSEHGAGAGPTRILPDGCMDLIVDVETGETIIAGVMTRAFIFAPSGPVRMVAVRFRPGGAIPFLRLDADMLADDFVDAAGAGVRWLTAAHVGGTDLSAAVRTLERVLLRRLHTIPEPSAAISRAVTALFGPSPPSVTELADAIGWSRQHLGRAIRRHIGISPVQLARVARLQRAIALLHSDRAPELAAVAVRAGYFDQAHMTRDFRDLAGVTPRSAAALRGSIHPIPSLLAGP